MSHHQNSDEIPQLIRTRTHPLKDQQMGEDYFYLSHDSPSQAPLESIDTFPQLYINEMLEKISQLTHELLRTQEKLFYYEDFNKKLLLENESLKTQIDQFEEKHFDQENNIKKLEEILEQQNKLLKQKEKQIERMCVEVQEQKRKEVQKENNRGNLEQASKMNKRNRQLRKINKVLENDLKTMSARIIELEREIQDKACFTIANNISRLRQTSHQQTQLQFSHLDRPLDLLPHKSRSNSFTSHLLY